ncbi:sensor histidine kinase [Dethiothermospora halolimnae]|uniref:sensor histidine kinase n=1 Tax=Dethiothermospora halolimnae TaxID=3114390 RepID=UPI003CCC0D37
MILIEGVFLYLVSNYYYDNIKENLMNRATVAGGFYNKYLRSVENSFENSVKQVLNNFDYRESAELQVIDTNGNIILSTSGFIKQGQVKTTDYINALNGKTSCWRGKDNNTGEEIMAVSTPLKYWGDNINGALRYVTSLEGANRAIQKWFLLSLIIMAIIIVLMIILSTIFSRSIINPINEITKVSKEMAKGRLSARIDKKYTDEIGELADTINFMGREISKVQNMKNEFISSISHELRTPLTAIKGWSETILTGGLKDREEAELGLKIIIKETKRLTNMVEELLDFSRIEEGRLTLCREKLNIKKNLEDIICIFKLRAQKEGIKLNYNLRDDIPEILGDVNRLKQVFINILDNAIKFTDKDKNIYVRLYFDRFIIIEVEDEGIGISKKDLPKVKEKFYKGPWKKSGNGLGLVISDEIIKLHGGRLEIESKVNKGTKITIKLPTNK